MTHTQTIIGIIIIAGLLGGFTNFLLLYNLTYKKKECWVSFFKSMFLGLCASITVPLFLQIIQTNLLDFPKDTTFQDKNYFVLFGFCVLAAIFSKTFLENLNSKVNKVEQKVDEVKKMSEEANDKAKENEKEIKNTQAGLFNNEAANAIKENKQDNTKNAAVQPENIKRGHIDKQNTMLAVASGTTFDDNIKCNIYYDPAKRTHAYDFKFIALYKSWGIRAVGEVAKVVYCDYDEDEDLLIPTKNEEVFRNLSTDELKKIKDIIINTKYYDLEKGIKFFLIDKFYETEYILDSPIMGKQYFWLNEFPQFNQNMSAEDIAKMLSELKPIY